jgi:hypothetical protein
MLSVQLRVTVAFFFAVVGLVGIIAAPRLLLPWVVLIGFGIASLPRAFLAWRRDVRGRPRR